jgi:hypothetical protein
MERLIISLDFLPTVCYPLNIIKETTMDITFESLTDFEKGYVTAALWTFDNNAPSGEYSTSGRVEILFPLIDQAALQSMRDDCTKFQADNKELLAQAGKDSQNGHDFWLTRNNHGSGFWDRDYDKEVEGTVLLVGDVLTDKAHAFGESDIYMSDPDEYSGAQKIFVFP